MAHAFHHAQSSAKRFGGIPQDYQAIHDFLDSSKITYADFRHRALLHNTFGIFVAEQVFGVTITNSNGKQIPVRVVAEQHVREDCNGHIPTPQEWLESIQAKAWMNPSPAHQRELMKEIEE
jgi:hypothetical protein